MGKRKGKGKGKPERERYKLDSGFWLYWPGFV